MEIEKAIVRMKEWQNVLHVANEDENMIISLTVSNAKSSVLLLKDIFSTMVGMGTRSKCAEE